MYLIIDVCTLLATMYILYSIVLKETKKETAGSARPRPIRRNELPEKWRQAPIEDQPRMRYCKLLAQLV